MAESVWIDHEVELRALDEADRRRASYAAMSTQITPAQIEQARGLLSRHPNLSAGLLQALVQAQVPDQQADQLADKDDGGWLGAIGDVAGDVIDSVTDGVEWGMSRAYEYGIKPAIRGAVLVSDTLAQEVVQRPLTSLMAYTQGEADSVGQAYNEYGDSAGVNLLQGDLDNEAEGGSLGTGFFLGGQAGAEADAERQLQINGRRADIGQAMANGLVGWFSEPGERAYDMTAGVSGFAVDIGGDPLAWATGGASKAIKGARALSKTDAVRVLGEAGAVSGARRNTVLVEKARDFFGNEKMLDRIAEADAYTIMQTWAQSPANRIDLQTIRRLGDASDQAQVAEVLFDAVAHGDVTRKGFYSGTGNFIKRHLVDSTSRTAGPFRYFTAEGKLSGLSPRGFVSADDLDDAALKVDSLLRQANIERDVRAGVFNRMAAVEPGRFDDLFDVVTDALDAVAVKVGGAADTSINDVAKAYRAQLNDLRQYGIDSWGGAVDVPYAKKKIVQNFDGTVEEVIVPTPQITSELNGLALHLPDVTEIRRAATDTALLRSVYTSKGWDFGASALKSLTHNLFKPLAILRPAYVVRIGAEEQARLVAEGFDSIWNHPFRFIQANIRNRDELKDLLGNDLMDAARVRDVITKDAHGVLADTAASRGRIFTVARWVEGEELSEQFVKGWRGELGQLSAAPEARKLAELRGNIDEFKTWAQAEGREHIERLAKVNDDAADLLNFGSGFDEWAGGLSRRLEAKTAGWDEDILRRIVDGDLPSGLPNQDKTANAAFANFLRGKARAGRAPAAVKAELVEEGRVRHLDSAVDWLFDHITGKPTSYLARYPAFRQSMLRRTADLMDSLADDALREQAFASAVANLGADVGGVVRETPQLRQLRKALDSAKGKPGGPINSLKELNTVVKHKSAQDVKDLLFDVTSRGAAQEALEVVVPFLDAWKEVTRTWMRLMKENPSFFVRAQAGYRELQDQGIFHVNEFGDEVFKMPGGQYLASFVNRLNDSGGELTDIPGAALGALADTVTGNRPSNTVELEGRVQGVNLVAQGIGPGFGPVIQWGAGVLPKAPDLDGVRDFLAPFGTGLSEPGDLTDPGVLSKTLLPAWFRKGLNAFREGAIDERQWNSTFGDAMKALVASGEVDPNDPDLAEKAERYAKWLLLTRSIGQFAGPTGPQADVKARLDANTSHEDWNPEIDPSGHYFSVGVLQQDYYRLLNTFGPEEASVKFYELYGAEPYFIAQAKTRSTRELPVTTEGDQWMRLNESFVGDHPVVAGYFAPTGEDADLDFGVYAGQIERGERQSLTPAQQVAMAQQVRARAIYNNVKQKVEGMPTAQKERVLQLTKARLEEIHPGWEVPVLGVTQGVRLPEKISELQRAVQDERMQDNPLVEPMAVYFRLRDLAIREAARQGLKTLSSDKVAHLRAALSQAGETIQQRYPSFVGVWSSVLSREVE